VIKTRKVPVQLEGAIARYHTKAISKIEVLQLRIASDHGLPRAVQGFVL